MTLRRLNDNGTEQFRQYLAVLRETPSTPPPSELIDDPRFTEILSPQTEIENMHFSSKYESGKYLSRALSAVPINKLRIDTGIWSWLAVLFFDQLCPLDGNGNRKAKDTVLYIARLGDHRFGLDKHLLFFPWKMYSLHGDVAYFLLSQSLKSDPREQREWTGYRHNLSTALVALCRELYWDEAKGAFKRGSKSTGQPGGLRRFVNVAKQLEITYDIHGMSPEGLAAILPRPEFDRWLDRSSSRQAAPG